MKHGSVNATVPKSKDPASLTMDEAVGLIAERAASGGGKKAKKSAKPKAAKAVKAPKAEKDETTAKAKPQAKRTASDKKRASGSSARPKKLAKAKA